MLETRKGVLLQHFMFAFRQKLILIWKILNVTHAIHSEPSQDYRINHKNRWRRDKMPGFPRVFCCLFANRLIDLTWPLKPLGCPVL